MSDKKFLKLVEKIENFEPINDNWLMLDELIIEACDTKNTIFIRPLLSIFERFPEHDGHGIFWSIIHGLEYIGDYEQDLLQSVLTSPNEFNLIMLNRILNSGITYINNMPVIDIFKAVSETEKYPVNFRKMANELFLRGEKLKS